MRPTVDAEETLAAEKTAARTRLRRLRDAIPAADRSLMAERIEDHLFSLDEVREAQTVLVFSSFGSEVPTDRIIDRLLHQSRRVVLPYLDAGGMAAGELRPGDAAVPTSYGPKEPPRREPVHPDDVDVVLAPGIAFDRLGYRLGYGGGHFDRYLGRLRAGSTRIGVAFHVQLVPSVPHGPGDEPMNIVVTDQEVIRI